MIVLVRVDQYVLLATSYSVLISKSRNVVFKVYSTTLDRSLLMQVLKMAIKQAIASLRGKM